MGEKLVKVKLGKKDYSAIYENWAGKLVRITSHPLDKGKLLVWRKDKWPGVKRYSLHISEAAKQESPFFGGVVREGPLTVAVAHYDTFGKSASVWDFIVGQGFRRKTVGIALRETILQHLKNEGANDVVFPFHKESRFYLKRGFEVKEVPYRQPGVRGTEPRYAGKMKELGVKPKGIKLKVLWQRARPRFVK